MAYVQHPLIRTVIGRAIEVHHVLGPGLMESSYSRCFAYELMTYLRLSEARQALIMNFNCVRLVDGIRSLVLSDDKRRRPGVPSDAVEVPIEGL